MQLWEDLMKIFDQLRGSGNIFGYKSTLANQLYLLYYFGGKIYLTRKLGKHLSYLWYGVVSSQILFTLVTGSYYLWWYDVKNDLLLMLNVLNSIGIIHMSAVIFPLITFWFGSRIEEMIEHVDDIFIAKSKLSQADIDAWQNNVINDAKKNFSWFLKPFAVCTAIYLMICFLDIVLFFQQHKPIDYNYYPYPPPLIQYFTSLRRFFFADGFVSAVLTVVMVQMWQPFGLILYWNVICSSELIGIRRDLCATTSDLMVHNGNDRFVADWDVVFERTLQRTIKRYQKTISLINYLKEFVEIIGTIMIIVAFLYGVAFLYVTSTADLSWVLKAKCITGYIISADVVFLFYTIGQNLHNKVFDVSQAVYSTPWYQSTKHRKNVCIFLCQTQSMKNFAVFKVYGLLYNNFSRYLHGLVSYTNILRRLTKK